MHALAPGSLLAPGSYPGSWSAPCCYCRTQRTAATNTDPGHSIQLTRVSTASTSMRLHRSSSRTTPTCPAPAASASARWPLPTPRPSAAAPASAPPASSAATTAARPADAAASSGVRPPTRVSVSTPLAATAAVPAAAAAVAAAVAAVAGGVDAGACRRQRSSTPRAWRALWAAAENSAVPWSCWSDTVRYGMHPYTDNRQRRQHRQSTLATSATKLAESHIKTRAARNSHGCIDSSNCDHNHSPRVLPPGLRPPPAAQPPPPTGPPPPPGAAPATPGRPVSDSRR